MGENGKMSKNQKNTNESQLHQSSRSKPQSTQFVMTARQSTALIASTLIGVGVLTLPRTASEEAHQSAWVASIFGALIAMIFMWVITKLGLRFRGQTIADYGAHLLSGPRSNIVGKVIIFPLLLLFILIWLSPMVIANRVFGEVVVGAVLRETPLEAIIVTMLIAAACLVFVEVEVIARFNEVIFPLIIIPVLAIAVLSLQNVHITNILPVFTVDWSSFLQGALMSGFAFQGFSIMLVYMAFVQKGKNVAANLTGVGIPGFIYALLIFSAIGVFGFEELQHLTWPTLELVKANDFAFFIFERLDALFIAVWVAAVYTTVGNFYYSACFLMAQLMPVQNQNKARKWIGVCLVPIFYWVSLIPENVYRLLQWSTYTGYAGIFILFIPVFLYVIAVVRNKERRHVDDEQRQTEES